MLLMSCSPIWDQMSWCKYIYTWINETLFVVSYDIADEAEIAQASRHVLYSRPGQLERHVEEHPHGEQIEHTRAASIEAVGHHCRVVCVPTRLDNCHKAHAHGLKGEIDGQVANAAEQALFVGVHQERECAWRGPGRVSHAVTEQVARVVLDGEQVLIVDGEQHGDQKRAHRAPLDD